MTIEDGPSTGKPTQVVVATTVLLSFISFWRAAAIRCWASGTYCESGICLTSKPNSSRAFLV